MSYGRPLKNPGSRGETPDGRTSWQDAQNQVKGNLKWAMNFLSAEEVIAKLANIHTQDYLPSSNKPKKRVKYLRGLKQFHLNVVERLETEIERTEAVIENSDDWEGFPSQEGERQ
ncbi:MAG: hypothetical protein ABEJ83_00955 [Candidatus Nanohaloarchaea archaeon]